jgi:hypothetical protein
MGIEEAIFMYRIPAANDEQQPRGTRRSNVPNTKQILFNRNKIQNQRTNEPTRQKTKRLALDAKKEEGAQRQRHTYTFICNL